MKGGGAWWAQALVVLFVLLIAVLHGDALHASFPHGSGGLLHGQTVAHRVIHLTVEGGVEHPLQAKVPVLFLQRGETRQRGVTHRKDSGHVVLPSHLGDPDEDFQLVDVQLLIHALGEPGAQQVHGGRVPLLKDKQSALQKNTFTHAEDIRADLKDADDVGTSELSAVAVTDSMRC